MVFPAPHLLEEHPALKPVEFPVSIRSEGDSLLAHGDLAEAGEALVYRDFEGHRVLVAPALACGDYKGHSFRVDASAHRMD